ncbi:dihydrofolate reductase family protein [Nocardioides zeicaulis]|uniref:Dihydrofolate reductase family protein n=1 Tax=Nocardioides zeicaulis TaxID=1776857 RepID=A0ABV6E006_9ACTN
MSETFELQRLADLTDEQLQQAYAPRGEPWMRVNFVSTVDGSATGADGLSTSINDDADKRVFDTLRKHADCLVVGAGTIRDEEYDVPKIPVVVVSRRADVPPTLREAPRGRVLVATVSSAEGLEEARELLGHEQVLVLGEDEIDLVALKAELLSRGWKDQLCEGGPSLFGDLLAAGVVDELCWTISPRLVAGDGPRIAGGPDVDVAVRPALLLEQDGTLLGRWLVG